MISRLLRPARTALARQLGHPSGWTGRAVLRMLNRANAVMAEAALAALALGPEDELLDVGFGGGDLLARALDTPGLRATGLDRSTDAVVTAAARFRTALDEDRLWLREGDAADLPFADRTFTAVASLNTLYFLDDPAAAFAEWARASRSGGRLALGYAAPASLRRRPLFESFHVHAAPDVEAMLAEAGWADVSTIDHGTRHRAFHLTRARRA